MPIMAAGCNWLNWFDLSANSLTISSLLSEATSQPGVVARCNRPVRRHVVYGVAKYAGAGITDGPRRGRIGSVATGDVARPRHMLALEVVSHHVKRDVRRLAVIHPVHKYRMLARARSVNKERAFRSMRPDTGR